jgi:hypothetical protein
MRRTGCTSAEPGRARPAGDGVPGSGRPRRFWPAAISTEVREQLNGR